MIIQRSRARSAARSIGLLLGLLAAGRAEAVCPYSCGDITGDALVDLDDFSAFSGCIGEAPATQDCICADMNGDGAVDLADYALLTLVFASASDETPPDCTGSTDVLADATLTAHRPQNGAGYAPLAKIAVADGDEESPTRGPGIRMNAPGDADPDGEDDLIEVLVTVDPPGGDVALRRSDTALRAWTTRDKLPGTEITFSADRTDALPIGAGQASVTVWIEWASPNPGTATLAVEPLASAIARDVLTFHTFTSIVIVLGGEGQVPSYPVDPNSGTFVVGEALYRSGYDALLFDEDVVAADGSGAAASAVEDAILHRGVTGVAIFGYSHGGGSTYSLADRLDARRPLLGVFTIHYTSYCDAVRNNSDVDVNQELRRPPSTNYHLNHYQHGTLFEDFFLDGGPVPDSNPPPTGLDVETTAWGANSTHFEVDDFVQVRSAIEATLGAQIAR